MGTLEKKMLEKFLSEKSEMLSQFSKYVGLDNLTFDIKELELIESTALKFIEDEGFAVLYNLYIGEVIINYIKGEWEIGKLKKDPAYHKPIILKSDKSQIRICPMADWFGLLKKGRLQEGISGIVKVVIKCSTAKE